MLTAQTMTAYERAELIASRIDARRMELVMLPTEDLVERSRAAHLGEDGTRFVLIERLATHEARSELAIEWARESMLMRLGEAEVTR